MQNFIFYAVTFLLSKFYMSLWAITVFTQACNATYCITCARKILLVAPELNVKKIIVIANFISKPNHFESLQFDYKQSKLQIIGAFFKAINSFRHNRVTSMLGF